jgi:hypothetical protein
MSMATGRLFTPEIATGMSELPWEMLRDMTWRTCPQCRHKFMKPKRADYDLCLDCELSKVIRVSRRREVPR